MSEINPSARDFLIYAEFLVTFMWEASEAEEKILTVLKNGTERTQARTPWVLFLLQYIANCAILLLL